MFTKKEMIEAAYVVLKENNIELDSDKFAKWVNRKANSLCKRDKERTKEKYAFTTWDYVEKICEAIKESPVFDFYTNDKLDWTKIGEYTNEEAQCLGPNIKVKYAKMPTVDHIDAKPEPNFHICTWCTNDAKNDLSLEDFITLCEKVLENNGYEVKKK